MPYKKTSELPPQFANVPEGGRKIAMNVINSMLASGATEEQAFAAAWSRIKQKYTKKGGKWVLKTKESKIAEIAEVFRALAEQGEAAVAEIGKTFNAGNWGIILQILALIQKLVSAGEQSDPNADPNEDPDVDPNAEPDKKPKPKQAPAKAQEAIKEALAGSMEALRDELTQIIDNKNVQGFCSCSTAPDRADYNWSTLTIEGTFADGRIVVSCRKCISWWVANWTRGDDGKLKLINIKPAAQVVMALEAQRNQEDAEIDEAAIALREAAGMDDDGIIKDACLIQPGWGSCGYYSAEMLTREAAKFNGVQMYVDHPTPVEEAQQPERTLKTLAGVVVGPVVFKESGWKGPGLYSPVKVFSDHRAAIKEKAAVIGLSAYGGAKAHIGEAEGRTGKIMDNFTKIRSVDFVTVAGAGGALPVIESAREELRKKEKPKDLKTATLADLKEARPDLVESLQVEIRESKNKEVKKPMEGNEELVKLKETVDGLQATIKEQEKKIQEQETANTKLRESVLLRDAGDEIDLLLKEAKIPDIMKARVKKECLLSIPVAEAGGLDKTKLAEAAKAKIAEAEAEFAAITKSGTVTGLGGGEATPATVKEAVGKEISKLFGAEEPIKEADKKTA